MLLAEHPLAALEHPPVKRQGPRRVAQRPHASGQIVQAGERLWILLAEHPLAALKRPPVNRPLFCKSRAATVHETPTFSPAFLTFCTLHARDGGDGVRGRIVFRRVGTRDRDQRQHFPSVGACARPRARGHRKSKAVAGRQDRALADRPADPIRESKNARTHMDAQIAAIAASIKEWGWTSPALSL